MLSFGILTTNNTNTNGILNYCYLAMKNIQTNYNITVTIFDYYDEYIVYWHYVMIVDYTLVIIKCVAAKQRQYRFKD